MATKSIKRSKPTPSVSQSPWVQYLTGRLVPADNFLQKMAKGPNTKPDETTDKSTKRKATEIIRPDSLAKEQFADAFAAKPERADRLVRMIHAAESGDVSIRYLVMDLVSQALNRLDILTFSEGLDARSFSQSIASWLSGIRKKSSNSTNLNLLWLFLYIGRQRHLVDAGIALDFISEFLAQEGTSWSASNQSIPLDPTTMELVFAIPPTDSAFSAMIKFFNVARSTFQKQTTQIQSQASDIARLFNDVERLNTTIAALNTEIAMLQEQKTVSDTTIADLEKQIVNTRAVYQHKIDDVRGRISGALEGQITRWLQTSLDAIRANPPRTAVVEERLEEVLKLIEKELQWLQPSA